MVKGFIASVASDLASELVSSTIVFFGGPSLDQIRDKVFWTRVMSRVVGKLCSGYEELESVEGQAFVLDQRFFSDPVVRRTFSIQILTGEVNRAQLRQRFVALHGNSSLEQFERNLDDALSIFYQEIESALDPALRANLKLIRSQIAAQGQQIEEQLRQLGKSMLASQSRANAPVPEQFEAASEMVPRRMTSLAVDTELISEYRAQLDQIQALLRSFQPSTALQHLRSLKDRIWDKATAEEKSRLLASMGQAHALLGDEPQAAQLLIDALQFKPESPKALSNAALGHLLVGKRGAGHELAERALKVDPTSVEAYSALVQTSSEADPFDAILSRIPEAYRESMEVSMALGQAARQRGMMAEAEYWVRKAVQVDDTNHPDPQGILADLLLARTIERDPSARAVGIATEDAALAAEAVSLYDVAWGSVAQTQVRSARVDWVGNRAVAKALLGRVEDAIRDADEALAERPDDPHFVKNRAMLAHQAGDLGKAASLFRSIIDSQEVVDARFWLAVVLAEDGKLIQAKDLVDEFLGQGELTAREKRNAQRLSIMIHVDLGHPEDARVTSDSLRASYPTDPTVLALSAGVARAENRPEDANALVLEAYNNLTSESALAARYSVAGELYEAEDFERAAQVLEEVVDPRVDSDMTRRLLTCYYRGGNLQPALEICKALRQEHGPLRYVTEVESAIHEEIEDLDSARDVCVEYLKVFPTDLAIRLRQAVISYRLHEFADLDSLLDEQIDTTSAEFHALGLGAYVQLSQLYAARDRVREALEVAYEGRRQFFDDAGAHLLYVRLFPWHIEHGELDWLDAIRVDVDIAVCVTRDSGDTPRWIIIEDREDADARLGELQPSHPLVVQLLGRKAGDSLEIDHGFYTETLVIKEIKSKFVHALHQILESYQGQFPDVPGVWRVPIPADAEGKSEAERFDPLFRMLDQQHEYHAQIERFYKEKKLPIGAMARFLGKNPIEIHGELMRNPELGIWCCDGSEVERDEAIALAASGCELVADIVSLMTLQYLNLGDQVVATHGKLGIVRETLELIEGLLKDQVMHSREYMVLGKVGEHYTRTLVTMEEIEHNKQVLESALGWAEENCNVLPCRPALTIARDTRSKLGDLVGSAFLSTILVANDEGKVLYSDDAGLRRLASAEYGANGMWTQPVLMNLQRRGVITDAEYQEAVIGLACTHYFHTSIAANTLIAASRKSKWRPTYPFSEVVAVLRGKHCDLVPALRVATEYVRLLWAEKLPQFNFELLVTAVLDALASDRARMEVLNQFDRGIRAALGRAPIAVAQVRGLMQAWAKIHIL